MEPNDQEPAVTPAETDNRFPRLVWVAVFRLGFGLLLCGLAIQRVALLIAQSHIHGAQAVVVNPISTESAVRAVIAALTPGIPSLIIGVALLFRARWAGWLIVGYDALVVPANLATPLLDRMQHEGVGAVLFIVLIAGVFFWEGIYALGHLTDSPKARLRFCTAVAAVFCAAFAWQIRTSWFPGSFVYARPGSAAIYDGLFSEIAVHRFWSTRSAAPINLDRSETGLVSSATSLSVSGDARHAVFLWTDVRSVSALLVLDIAAPPLDAKKSKRSIDLTPYHIRFCPASNLEWSPDDQTIAYAEDDCLRLIDVRTGRAASLPIAEDPVGGALRRAWDRDFHPPKDTSGLGMAIILSGSTPILDKRVVSAVKGAQAELRADLRLPDSLRLKDLTHWQSVAELSTGTRGEGLVYALGGHRITWTSSDTIYCDNWRLTLSRDRKGKLTATARKTPLPSAFFARPMWSPKGDKAAYLLQLPMRKGRDRDMTPAMLVIVDSSGKVLRSRQVCARAADGVRWSRDSARIAVYAFRRPRRDRFDIYDVNTFHNRRVRPDDKSMVECGGAAWDWVCP